MALSAARIQQGGETSFPWERDAVDFVLEALPDSDPHLAWPLHELLDPGTGRLYEIDLMVLARSGLFLIEIKSHPGVLDGDARDWIFTREGHRPKHISCPYPSTNHKAKVLAGLLQRHLGRERPFVQPLIFVAHESVKIRLQGGRPDYVVDRETIRRTLVHGLPGGRRQVVNRPVMRKVREAMRQIGFQPSKASRIVAGYELRQLLDEGEGYQEHHGTNTSIEGDVARVRSYLVPRATSIERRQMLERAARREAEVLSRLGRHPRILSYRTYQDDGPLGPAVIFEAFEGGQALDAFLRQEPELPFDDRLEILEQVVEAVDHCHRAGFLHRNLSPASVLVRRGEHGLEVRVHRFQTASQADRTSLGTGHLDQLAEDLDRLYQAPEVLADPARADTVSDVFSAGCLAWLLLTGRRPAATVPEREHKIREHQGLRIAAVRSDLAALDGAIAIATEWRRFDRPDDVLEWFENDLLEDLTRPAPAEEPSDPYEAEKEDDLGHGLVMERVLGSGATAKVLRVRRDGRTYALKVPHDDGCARRLLDEAEVLRKLSRHQHVVQLHEVLSLAGRECLLLDYAGERSLADVLRSEGTLSLDKARRYGDDLLSAVQHLEEEGVTHRDIKPGNLGFTTRAKKARHLALFDFSLSAADPTAVAAGTPEWRDPWLHLRDRWDGAADRYSAAAVLYCMLAGARPEIANRGPDRDRIHLEPERFDAGLRDRLSAFFVRAFAEAVEDRFASAEQMRGEWNALFVWVPASLEHPRRADREVLASATAETPVEALPLSARARNALDRGGVATVADLLRLPRNHLSAIRGIGHAVAREILGVADDLRARLSITEAPPLVAEFPGPRRWLIDEDLGLTAQARDRLVEAGILHTADLALSPDERIRRLIGAEQTDQLRRALQRLAADQPVPGSLAQWIDELLAPRGRRATVAERRIRVLVGLDPLPASAGRRDGGSEDAAAPGTRTVQQVAEAFGVDPALIHGSLQAMRRQWQDAPCREPLITALREVIESLGPVTSLVDAARELARRRTAGEEPRAEQEASTTVLIRLATELRPAAIHWRRLDNGSAWVALRPSQLDALAGLAAAADSLAGSEPLPSSEQVREVLTAAVAPTALATLAPDRLVSLAAAASSVAAASARLELYPRSMAPERALKLSFGILTPPGLTPAEVRRRVRARYPHAAPLPERPELDTLLARHQLNYDDQQGEYLPLGLAHASSSATLKPPPRLSSALPDQRPLRDPKALEALAFQDALDRGVERGRFRVVQVVAAWAERAATLLAESLGTEPVSLDHRIWAAVERKAAALNVVPDKIIEADRAGPEGPEWEILTDLVRRAAAEELEQLLEDRRTPRLLVHPGALARYHLGSEIRQLAHRAQHEDGAAVVLVVPSHADGLAPSINGRLPVPTENEGQRLLLPRSWLENRHRAAAT